MKILYYFLKDADFKQTIYFVNLMIRFLAQFFTEPGVVRDNIISLIRPSTQFSKLFYAVLNTEASARYYPNAMFNRVFVQFEIWLFIIRSKRNSDSN